MPVRLLLSIHPFLCETDVSLAVGSGQSGTKTLEKSKQWWYLVKHVGEVGKRSRVFEESFVDERALTEMYYIIAFDHIGDQSPKAATGASLITAGGYRSTVLSVWNKVHRVVFFSSRFVADENVLAEVE